LESLVRLAKDRKEMKRRFRQTKREREREREREIEEGAKRRVYQNRSSQEDRYKSECAVTTIDIIDAVDSAKCCHIMGKLTRLEVSYFLLKILRSYLTNRLLLYTTYIGQKHSRVTSGVPQGSILYLSCGIKSIMEFLAWLLQKEKNRRLH